MLPFLLAALLLSASPASQSPGTEGATPAVSYQIPYHLSETNHFMLRGKINGQGPFNFIMDTGAPAVFLSKSAAAQCRVKPLASGWGTFDRMEIEGGAVLEKVKARIEEPSQLTGMNALGLSSDHIDGVVGYNLLSQFRIQIDLTRPKMTWTRVDYTPDLPTDIGRLTDEMTKAQSAAIKKASNNVKQMADFTQMVSAMNADSKPPQTVPRGFIGMELADTPHGPQIERILPQSPAAAAGLREGDLVVRVAAGGEPAVDTKHVNDVLRATSTVSAGDSVVFVVHRGTSRIKAVVHTGKGGL